MIPKILHYCWFGSDEMPEPFLTWFKQSKQLHTDYKIYVWTLDNIQDFITPECEELIKDKKWAFLSDYIRLKVLYIYGGIYLDADVEVLESFTPLLNSTFVISKMNERLIDTGVIGCEPADKQIEVWLDAAEKRLGNRNNDWMTNSMLEDYKKYIIPKEELIGTMTKMVNGIEYRESKYAIHWYYNTWNLSNKFNRKNKRAN